MTNPIDGVNSLSATSGATSPFTQARQDAMNAVANQLGMSPTDLRQALSSGETLTQVAASKGISASALQSTIATSLQSDLPNASSSQIDGLASRMMSGAHHGHHAHGGGGAGGASSASSSGASSGADATGDGNSPAASTFSVTV